MSWSYRIVTKKVGDETWYGMHEVYYDEEDTPISCTVSPVTLEAENMESMDWMLGQFKIATNQPWLKYEDFD